MASSKSNSRSQTSFITNSYSSSEFDDIASPLFGDRSEETLANRAPLAALIRPQTLDEFIGQEHLVGKNGPIRRLIEAERISSMIFWGPPGCGKTTLAEIIANTVNAYFARLSAVDSKKADVKRIVDFSRNLARTSDKKRTIVFLDEIHRFNKAQQDFLLPYVEDGTIILIGATTENPSFEVISALLSRSRVFVLKRHTPENLGQILDRATQFLKAERNIDLEVGSEARDFVIEASNGDPRTLLNAIEMGISLCGGAFNEKLMKPSKLEVSKQIFEDALQHRALMYDKGGEEHYNIISALHKSMRSSDENAALYWLARMLEAGEDPLYVARRMLRFAAEDIGNADPQATILANAVFQACEKIGMPECNVHLAQLAVYLARAPKDNSAYIGYARASKDAQDTLNLPVPLHLRNAVTPLMKNIGYGKGYVYDHDVKGKRSGQQCLPDELKGRKYV